MYYTFRHYTKRRGLTLVELLVVLTIITAVATIIIPILPNTNQISGGSTGSGNMREVIKAVETHRGATGDYPENWDSLIDSNGVILPTTAPADLAVLDISSPISGSDEEAIANALANASITQTFQHVDFTDTDVNQTFDGMNAVNELGAGNVAVLTTDGETALGLNASGGDIVRYVAFGLGNNSTMIGRTMADAPVKFLSGGDNPSTQYARWIVIFTVFDDETLRLSTVAGLDDNELQGINFHLNDFYNAF
ncbi:prepilin-type N-terminal cleavage/methylation domain-containing protein [Rubellicoccus peritrichatus]|uniref:Prepilin-type N-terminal cleavage/methylation domain-containing protein n=1 Tax=Rubellicoccus peritrichatus TaxID=3080537 RepID=A0AAQ3QTL1_9BACT|nr:prepilin-type N-terminal cleavage/methylation domain-containing protein [Puniceicoccus sp. CR14]WOO39498.1 prepilin-type N-terminal cleavage/methylation domain-containing protein [Puniceicoccus sp. CR14]